MLHSRAKITGLGMVTARSACGYIAALVAFSSSLLVTMQQRYECMVGAVKHGQFSVNVALHCIVQTV